MRELHLAHLACPACRSPLRVAAVAARDGDRIRDGVLACTACEAPYPVERFVPRFVPRENYTSSFGLQWQRHADTQLDSRTGTDASRRRFFGETRWPERMDGERVLEAGSGAGRVTEILAGTGATVVSVDSSEAVDANFAANGHHPNVVIVQGDIFRLPVPEAYFGRVCCAGVLQHTPDPRRAFLSLQWPLRPGGCMAVDVYAVRWYTPLLTKYWVRPVTRRMSSEALHRACRRWVHAAWPVARRVARLPGGRLLNQLLLVQDNGRLYDLTDEQRREWAVLDTFDILSPRYDSPQRLRRVRRWFEEAGLEAVEVHYGWNGIEGRGCRPAGPSSAPPAPVA
jgi:SAM-dependent methyltransferase